MTFKQVCLKHLARNGMSDAQASAVFEMMKNDNVNAEMRARWDDSVDDYPQIMTSIAILAANTSALEWIDANLPKAWYRPMFV